MDFSVLLKIQARQMIAMDGREMMLADGGVTGGSDGDIARRVFVMVDVFVFENDRLI